MELFELIKLHAKQKGVMDFNLKFRKTAIAHEEDLWIAQFKTRKTMYSSASIDPLKAIEKAINQLVEGMKNEQAL